MIRALRRREIGKEYLESGEAERRKSEREQSDIESEREREERYEK